MSSCLFPFSHHPFTHHHSAVARETLVGNVRAAKWPGTLHVCSWMKINSYVAVNYLCYIERSSNWFPWSVSIVSDTNKIYSHDRVRQILPQAVRQLGQFWINSRTSDHAEFLNLDLNIAIAYTVKS